MVSGKCPAAITHHSLLTADWPWEFAMPDEAIIIVCPSCRRRGRIAKSKLGRGILCAKCNQKFVPASSLERESINESRQPPNEPLMVEELAPAEEEDSSDSAPEFAPSNELASNLLDVRRLSQWGGGLVFALLVLTFLLFCVSVAYGDGWFGKTCGVFSMLFSAVGWVLSVLVFLLSLKFLFQERHWSAVASLTSACLVFVVLSMWISTALLSYSASISTERSLDKLKKNLALPR